MKGMGSFLCPLSQYGYPQRKFEVKGKTKAFFIHRAVAELFIENTENKPCVNHIDGDKTNNDVSNLEWCTHAENMAHAKREGLTERSNRVKTDEANY